MRAKFANTTLVIFGAGYIGGRLAEQAIAEGGRVTALTRNPERAAHLRSLGATVVVADLADTAWHTAAGLRGNAGFVVDCASGGGDLACYRRSYLDGMGSILAWARATGQEGRLIYTGSTSVYPQGNGARVDETMPTSAATDAAAGTDVASAILLETEREALRWPGAGGACVLRLAGIYGPGRHHLLGQLREAAASGAELSGGPDDHLNLIYRDDVCDAIRAAAAGGATGGEGGGGGDGTGGTSGAVFNIADNAAPTRAELCGWLAQRLELPEPRFSGQPAPGRRRRTPDRIIVNALARRSLGWEPAHPDFRAGYEAIFAEEARETGESTRNG